MKKQKIFLFLTLTLCLFILFSAKCAAEDGKTAVEELEEKWKEQLPEGAASGIGEDGAKELSDSLGFSHILESVLSSLAGEKSKIGSFLMILLGASVFMAAAEAVPADCRLSAEITAGIGCISALSIAAVLAGAFQSTQAEITKLTAFFSGILPMFSAVLCAGGSTLTAGVQSAGMNLSLSLIGWLNEKILLPIAGCLLAFAPLGTVDTAGRISAISEKIHKCFLFFLGVLSALLLGTLALQTSISSAKDSSAVRAAKYAASLLPAVGSTLSGSLSVLSSGIVYLKSAVGVSAVAAMIGMAAAPLAELILYRLCFFISGFFLSAVGAKSGEKVLSSFRTALDAVTAVYVCTVAICLLESVIFLKSGVGIG